MEINIPQFRHSDPNIISPPKRFSFTLCAVFKVDYSDGCDVYIGDAETARRVNEEALTLESAHELAVALATGGDLSCWVDEN
jgi:intergrase/recombinase